MEVFNVQNFKDWLISTRQSYLLNVSDIKEMYRTDIPLQDVDECGLFMLKFATCIVLKEKLQFDTDHMEVIRLEIFKVIEEHFEKPLSLPDNDIIVLE